MPRKTLIRSKGYPYHISARGNNRDPFPLDPMQSWRIFYWNLNEARELFKVKIHAFVMMPNHFHLLMSTPDQDLGIVMQRVMASVTKTINFKSGRSGRIFGSRYHWSLIDSVNHYDCVLKYVYRNPVKANLSPSVESYVFSTLTQVVGGKEDFLSPPFGETTLISGVQMKDYLVWLNQPFLNEQESAIGLALKKSCFKLPKVGWKRRRGIWTTQA